MTGHIRRRGKNSFELKFDIGVDPQSGKRRIRYHSFKGTRRAAEIELANLVSANAHGAYVDPSTLTVADFFDRWDRDWASVNISSAKTLERYRQIIKVNIKPHIGSVRVQRLKPVTLTEFYASMLREGRKRSAGGLSARTVNHIHRLLHQALGHAALWGIVQQNVAALVKPPKVTETEIVVLSPPQIGKLFDHIKGRTLYPIVALAIATGARRGELLGLRRRDLDLDAAAVTIARSIEQTKAGLRVKAPKTKHGRRTVSIPPSTVTDLRAHLAAQDRWRLKLGMGKAGPDAPLFARRIDGEIRAPHWLTQKFSQAVAAIGINDVTLHCLRHTHASALIASGMDVLTISRRLGHGSPVITLKTYGHLFGNTDAKAAEIMEATFGRVNLTTQTSAL